VGTRTYELLEIIKVKWAEDAPDAVDEKGTGEPCPGPGPRTQPTATTPTSRCLPGPRNGYSPGQTDFDTVLGRLGASNEERGA